MAKVDLVLLVFLLLFLDVKIYCKLAAIIFIYCIRFNFKLGYHFRFCRLPLFYPAIILLAFCNLLFYRLYTNLTYDAVFVSGLLTWLLCILVIHQLKLSVERTNQAILNQTLVVFFCINAAASLVELLVIIIETGAINPYQYQGLFQKYFIGTGDYIKGIFFDNSTTNAFINALGVIYFLFRKQFGMVLLCMIILLLTGSNSTNFILITAMLYLFFFHSNRIQKSIISLCLFLGILFLAKVSPQNNQYVFTVLNKAFSRQKDLPLLMAGSAVPLALEKDYDQDQRKRKIAIAYLDSINRLRVNQPIRHNTYSDLSPLLERPGLEQPDINSREYQSNTDTTIMQWELIKFSRRQNLDPYFERISKNGENLPGKLIAMQQTLNFLNQKPYRWLTGAGLGNFSSKMAFRASTLKIAGGYPPKLSYINQDFLANHLALFIYYFIKRKGLHSVINTPDSVYDQLTAEYGLPGILCFLLFYLGYFVRLTRDKNISIAFFLVLLGAFAMGYWFEQLSVVVIFEFFILLLSNTDGVAHHPKN